MMLEEFKYFLIESEKSESTQKNYLRAVKRMLMQPGYENSKEWLLTYREDLKQHYSGESVNNHIAALNQYLEFLGIDWKMKYIKIQRKLYIDEEKDFTLKEYELILKECKKDDRMYLLIQTLCATGIRISELKYVTVECLKTGSIYFNSKAKYRKVLLPDLLIERLKCYCIKKEITSGEIFITRTGNSLNRSNIWHSMKKIAVKADINPSKIFPHNLRHLFAKVYYDKDKDLSKLADILGHTNLETTRRYLITSGKEHKRQINSLGLVE